MHVYKVIQNAFIFKTRFNMLDVYTHAICNVYMCIALQYSVYTVYENGMMLSIPNLIE